MSAANGKMPWFPFYVDRFLGSRKVRRMSAEQVGIYTLLLAEQWSGGPLPDDDEELAFMGKGDADMVRKVLKACFHKNSDGCWSNPVLEEIRDEQMERHQAAVVAGKLGASKRWKK